MCGEVHETCHFVDDLSIHYVNCEESFPLVVQYLFAYIYAYHPSILGFRILIWIK